MLLLICRFRTIKVNVECRLNSTVVAATECWIFPHVHLFCDFAPASGICLSSFRFSSSFCFIRISLVCFLAVPGSYLSETGPNKQTQLEASWKQSGAFSIWKPRFSWWRTKTEVKYYILALHKLCVSALTGMVLRESHQSHSECTYVFIKLWLCDSQWTMKVLSIQVVLFVNEMSHNRFEGFSPNFAQMSSLTQEWCD